MATVRVHRARAAGLAVPDPQIRVHRVLVREEVPSGFFQLGSSGWHAVRVTIGRSA